MDSAIKEGGWTLEIEEDPNSGQSDQQETRQYYWWHGVLVLFFATCFLCVEYCIGCM